MFVPQPVPLETSLFVSVQTGVPVVQERVPVWQRLAGGHDAPCVQIVHEPVRHTSFVPHAVPSVTSVPVSLHTGMPLEQSVEPT